MGLGRGDTRAPCGWPSRVAVTPGGADTVGDPDKDRGLFRKNFERYGSEVDEDIRAAAPGAR